MKKYHHSEKNTLITTAPSRTSRAFTLIELLVVVAIIAVLAAIIIFAVGRAKLKAKDAAVMSSLTSFRNIAELEFAGDFTTLCSSDSYLEIEDYVESQGGSLLNCQGENENYVIIATLPSGNESSLSLLAPYAYAQRSMGSTSYSMDMGLGATTTTTQTQTSSSSSNSLSSTNDFLNGTTPSEERSSFCINSHGTASKISLADYVRVQSVTQRVKTTMQQAQGSQQQQQFQMGGGKLNLTQSSSSTASSDVLDASLCTVEDVSRVMGIEASEVIAMMESSASLPTEGSSFPSDDKSGGSTFETYSYECEDPATGELSCYDNDNDEYVDLSFCEDAGVYAPLCQEQASPAPIGGGGGIKFGF